MRLQYPGHKGGSRLSFAVLLCVLGVGLCGASIAWACAPGNYGWDPPSAPASESPQPGQAGGSVPAVSQPPPSSAPEGGTVNSPDSAPVQSPNAAPVQSPGRIPAKSPPARQPAAQSPAGTSPQVNTPAGAYAPGSGDGSVGGEGIGAGAPVAQSPSPESGGANRASGRDGARAGGRSPAQSPTAQSAVGDLWSGFEADEASSLTPSGADGVPADSGPGSGFGVGLALVGLGGAALLGGLALTGARRRRSVASMTDDR